MNQRLAVVLSCCLIAWGLVNLMAPRLQHYHLKAHATSTQQSNDNPRNFPINWDELRQINDNVSAWLRVEGSSIDTAVVKVKRSNPDFYLSHDFWNAHSIYGCPFLAQDSSADNGIQIVYGHHITGSKEAFSDIFDAWRAERFFQLGSCHWVTPKSGELELLPLCSFVTNCWDEEVQTSSYPSLEEFRGALRKLAQRSETRPSHWDLLCNNAERAVILITCSSLIPGQDERCCTVFVR
ncbi:MAG: hypothetical protein IJ125_04980 [Atopobiaceae bacterium]|nr:hypothetical protein [Atopobiaceae bacterium]